MTRQTPAVSTFSASSVHVQYRVCFVFKVKDLVKIKKKLPTHTTSVNYSEPHSNTQFLLFTNWILCCFFFPKHPNSPKINHISQNTFQRCSRKTQYSPNVSHFSSLHHFLFAWNLTAILAFPMLFSTFFLEITLYFICVFYCVGCWQIHQYWF